MTGPDWAPGARSLGYDTKWPDWRVLIISIQWHSILAVRVWQGINKGTVSLSPRYLKSALFPKCPLMLTQCVPSRYPLWFSPGFTNIGKNFWPQPNPLICVFKFFSFLYFWWWCYVWPKAALITVRYFRTLFETFSWDFSLTNFAWLLTSHCRVYVFREVWAWNNGIQDEIGWYTTMSHWNTIQSGLDWL